MSESQQKKENQQLSSRRIGVEQMIMESKNISSR
ncbi:hypothetical protein [uncultured Nostoc sp.]